MSLNRRRGDRRQTVRRQSNEIIDTGQPHTFSGAAAVPWPFPIVITGTILCGNCGVRYSAQSQHRCERA
jgi:hypothetical protein